ncbi:Protein-lysine N-methyltransferase EFM5 [Drechslerella dactyloides]|uniref:Protein-lysine N-methyltransferase EFM5 n=1 Tax=Drechslerella dactyloides TaxID=74499 RepID=A0AAD6J718_DREDA|nr:Protein-lysine N-methyltransferase EFM5 [Drechslerella dactyloides]
MEDDDLRLSASTLAALQEFMHEKDTRRKRFEDLKAQAEDDDAARKRTADSSNDDVTMEDFEADWNASQFWYSEETSRALAEELAAGADEDTKIALVSAPRFVSSLLKDGQVPKCAVQLFEFDRRFALFGDEFTFYDFNEPVKLPPAWKGAFDRILVDPPFLSEDSAVTVRWLAKSWTPAAPLVGDNPARPDVVGSQHDKQQKVIVCTGERMKGVVDKMYRKAGVRCTGFDVQHAQGLSNEFRCYANFECARWKWDPVDE